MRRLLGAAVAIAIVPLSLLGNAAVAVAPLPAAQATPVAEAGAPLIVIEHAITDTVVDLGPEGDSLGDTLAFGNPLFDESNATEVGRSQGSCVRVEVGAAWECSWTNILPGGSLVVQGPFYDTTDSVLAITGGTGDYAGARGQMALRSREGGTEYEFAFQIQ